MKIDAAELLRTTQGNPLLRKLGPFRTLAGLADALQNNTTKDILWGATAVEEREMLLSQLSSIFCVSESALMIAKALQSLIWDGLIARDPRDAAQRRRVYQTAEYSQQAFESLPWQHTFAGGMIIRGITGVGKSSPVDRYLSLLPQVDVHERNEAAEWVEFHQLVYLRVHMPADGSRGGFLQNCLLAIDAALGTDYAQRRKSSTVERMLVDVLHYLSLHRCGLLVIEEAQENNLSCTPFSRGFLTFFLRLLNHGIPVAIVGNPLAFSNLDTFTQDISRFTRYGDFRLMPVLDHADHEWRELWMPELWGSTLLDHPDEEIEGLPELIWNKTAGFPRFLALLRTETLRAAMQTGCSHVTREHIDIAWESPSMKGVRCVIETFTTRDLQQLRTFNDIPFEEIRAVWYPLQKTGKASTADDAPPDSVASSSDSSVADPVLGPAPKKPRKRKKSPKEAGAGTTAMPEGSNSDPSDIRSSQYIDAMKALIERGGK